MATVNIAFGYAGGRGGPPSHAPVLRVVASENLTPSGTSQATTNAGSRTASGASASVVQITTDSDVWIAIGTAPVATTSGILLLAGQTRDFFVDLNEKVAVLAASL